jgi:hypothetical protein
MARFLTAKRGAAFSESIRATAKGSGRRPRRHGSGASPAEKTYRAGEMVRESGIYEAIHEGEHRGAHEVVLIESDLFPPCDTRSDQIRFRMLRTAPYIFTDADFEKMK